MKVSIYFSSSGLAAGLQTYSRTIHLSLAVIINEHLMEALRRLRRGAANTNVDRRLVTNILLTFLSTPREDTKRFEILGLLSSILSWSDEERARAGLQRMGANSASAANSPVRPRALELEKTDETEVRDKTLVSVTHRTEESYSLSPAFGLSFFSRKQRLATPHLHLVHPHVHLFCIRVPHFHEGQNSLQLQHGRVRSVH
jgi:GRAB domain